MVGRLALLAALLIQGAPDRATGSIYTVGARSEVQLGALRSIAGVDPREPETLRRTRYVQYLQLGAHDLGSRGPDERIDFVTSLRLDQDFGLTAAERRAFGLEQPAVHLLYGYLQWRGALGGVMDARLGRQVVLRELDFYSFDGLELTFHTRAHLAVTTFGGLLVTGASPLGSPTFGPDGVRRSDRRRIRAGQSTYLLDEDPAAIAYDFHDSPSALAGVRLDLEGVRGVGAGIGYRRAMSRTTGARLSELPEQARGWQVDIERLSADARWAFLPRFEVLGALDHDLFRGRPAAARAGLVWQTIPYRLTSRLEWSLYNPSFDADSIWNYFSTGPRQEVELRADAAPRGPFRYTAGLLLTGWFHELNPDVDPDTGGRVEVNQDPAFLPGFLVAAGTKPGTRVRAGADVIVRGQPGEAPSTTYRYLGRQLFAGGLVGYDLVPMRHALDLRISVANVSDPTVPSKWDLWSHSAALLSRNRLLDELEVTVIGEGSTNEFSRRDLRLYTVLSLLTDFR